MNNRTILLIAVFAFVLGGTSPMVLAEETKADEPQVLNFATLCENPENYMGAQVSFKGQYHQAGKLFSAFYTVFTSASHVNFSAWDFEATLWVKDVFKHDFPYLYADKGNSRLCDTLSKIKPFARFEATGWVRCVFNNVPWIEITSLKLLPKQLTRNSIYHMARGYYQKDKGDHLNAVVEFSQAYEEGLPTPWKALVRKEEAKSLFILESYVDAVQAFEDTIELSGDGNDRESEFLLKEALALMEYEEVLQEEYEDYLEDLEDEEEIVLDEDNWEIEESEVIEKEVVEMPEPVVEEKSAEEEEVTTATEVNK